MWTVCTGARLVQPAVEDLPAVVVPHELTHPTEHVTQPADHHDHAAAHHDSPPAGGSCTATYKVINQYPGGFQGEVTVKAGTTAISAWTVAWTFQYGQTISQLWQRGPDDQRGRRHGEEPALQRTLAANATTTFGCNATWTTTNAVPAPPAPDPSPAHR